MWPFKRKKNDINPGPAGPQCPHCKSRDTRLVTHHGGGEAAYAKVWRGQRYLTFRCSSCGQDFYAEDSGQIVEIELDNDDRIDDPQALQAAEDELKRQVDEEDDRMFK